MLGYRPEGRRGEGGMITWVADGRATIGTGFALVIGGDGARLLLGVLQALARETPIANPEPKR